MKKIFFLSCVFLLMRVTASQAGGFAIDAQRLHPASIFAADCLFKAPLRRCCTDHTAASCNAAQGCQISGDCPSSPNLTCATVGGDNGMRCCTNSGASSCESSGGGNADTTCDADADCAGHGSFTTCAPAYGSGSELPFPKWECDPTNSPILYGYHDVPDDINSSYDLTCFLLWNAKAVSGAVTYKLRAIAIDDYASSAAPSLTGGDFPSITQTVSTHPYWRNSTGTGTFCIEDASTGACCTGSACKGKIIKIAITVDAGSTIALPRTRAIVCTD